MNRTFVLMLLNICIALSIPAYAQNNWDIKDDDLLRFPNPKNIKCPVEHLFDDITVNKSYYLQREHNNYGPETLYEIQFDIDQDGHKDSLI